MGNFLIDNYYKSERTIGLSRDKKKWTFQEGIDNDSGIINICPKNFQEYIKDISFEHINIDNESQTSENIYTKFLNKIPKINIREYQMDLPEDRWLDISTQTYYTLQNYLSGGINTEIWKKTMEKLKTSILNNSLFNDIITNMYKEDTDIISFKSDDKWAYDFVAIVYRRLMSYNIIKFYTLPYNGIIQFGSNGTNGWNSTEFLKDFQILSKISINTIPTWRFNGDNQDSIQFELNLFNDTMVSAIRNFQFIHSIIPENMWTQYGLFQHSPATYDLQFDGGLRYFCCSLDIKCENVGQNRTPKQSLIDELNKGFYQYTDTNVNFKNKLKNIRIPDVYKLTFNFKSLFPNNFNQYMMTFREKDNIIIEDKHYDSRQESRYTKVSKAVADAINKAIK